VSVTKRRLFPRRGYILLIVGILIGFLAFSSISLAFFQFGRPAIVGEMPEKIEFEFLYTSEKQGWIEGVTPKFERWFLERFGVEVSVKLTVTGTHKTVNLILLGSEKPTVWSPASSIWIPYLNSMWRAQGNVEDIARDWTPLVLSPIVIAGWKSFLEKYNVTGFSDLYGYAAGGIDFKYGHPDPQLSNGGVMVAILEFAEAAGKKPEDLSIDDLKQESVLNFVRMIESKAVMYGESTGFFGSWAAENGPAAISLFGVYENVVIESSLKAKTKWGDPIVAVYPKEGTLLSDHPFVILNAEWVGKWERFAAGQYLLYLLKGDVQELAQKHGFRPANPSVPLDPKLFSIENGVQYELVVPVLKPLQAEAMKALLTTWVAVRNPGI